MPHKTGERSFALVATLALLVVATLLLALFVSTTLLDRSASFSYSQSVKADQIGLGGLHLIEGQLQAEMYKDSVPDNGSTGTYTTIFTNVTSYNILPQPNVTNSSLPSLIKMSTNATPFYTGTLTTSLLQASSASSTATSLNGRSVSTNVWNQICLGQYPTSASAPNWVIVTRNGPTNAVGLTFGTTGNTMNNPTPGNNNGNYVVGRFAYAIYDEGGLLDINSAGYPGSGSSAPLTTAQLMQIKGTLAGANLAQITNSAGQGITNPSAFIQWRNAASAASANTFVSYVTNFASTNGFQQVYPGDSAFISRQDLIKAAQNGNEGFDTNALPYLATFTRELNAPSWAPSVNGSGATTKYNYAANALSVTSSPFGNSQGNNKEGTENPNPFIPMVRYVNGGTVTGYNSNGTTYTYTVNVGDSVVQHRFPLDRLAWITPVGPSALIPTSSPLYSTYYNPGGTVAAIKACFGLYWATAENKTAVAPADTASWSGINVWKYVGSSLTVNLPANEVSILSGSPVETLSDVGKEASPREPNFFELLQAGVLPGSLGINLGATSVFQFMNNNAQTVAPFQLFRIGASIISQVQSSAYPINIEINWQGYSLVASGVANLPYLNALKFVEGVDGATSDSWSTSPVPMATYGLIGLWNPHQQSHAGLTRPNVRVYVQGDVTLASGWATNYPYVPYWTQPPAPPSPLPTSTPWTNTYLYGQTSTLTQGNYYVQLQNTTGSTTGVNGFLNPFAITKTDVDTANTAPSYNGSAAGWTSSTAPLTYPSVGSYADGSVNYEALQFPDVNLAVAEANVGIPGFTTGSITTGTVTTAVPETMESNGYGNVHFSAILGDEKTASPTLSTNESALFQIIMKYQDPNNSANWVPYDYWSGASSAWSWWNPQFTLGGPTIAPIITGTSVPTYTTITGGAYTPLPTVDETMHSVLIGSGRYHSGLMLNGDPRVTRFGIFPMSGDDGQASTGTGGSVDYPMIDSIWSGSANTTPPFNISGYGGAGSGGAAPTGLPNELNNIPSNFANYYLPAYLSRNNTAYPNVGGSSVNSDFTAYQDPDGIQRIGDSGLFLTPSSVSGAATTGNPFYDPSDSPTISSGQRTADRPIVLNRPFAGVGELGYVCRDDPWRSLDFFSAFTGTSTTPSTTSADSGLLDLYTVTDSPNTVVAGRVNLNTKIPQVLQAIFSGTMANTGDTTDNTSVSAMGNPIGMANALIAYTSTASLVNKDQLVTQFGPSLGSTGTLNPAFGNLDEQNVKIYREAYVRSLADVGQTRTWNLLIDLVAQAGKYPPKATSLSQFDVEGERHYWLHIAIDRFTGKIIDRQLELIGP